MQKTIKTIEQGIAALLGLLTPEEREKQKRIIELRDRLIFEERPIQRVEILREISELNNKIVTN